MTEVVVVETLQAAPGKTAELKNALLKLVSPCRSQKGNLQYDLLEPLTGSGTFLVLMRWKSPNDLASHESSQIIQDFVAHYDQLLYREVIQTEWKVLHHPSADE